MGEVSDDAGPHRVVGGHGVESVVHVLQSDGFGDELAGLQFAGGNLVEQVAELDSGHAEGTPEVNFFGDNVVDGQRYITRWPFWGHANLNMDSPPQIAEN